MKRQYVKKAIILFRPVAILGCLSLGLLQTACAPATTPYSQSMPAMASDVGSAPPISSGNSSSVNNNITSTQPPLQFNVTGTGNHPQYICVKAATQLWLKVIPNQVTAPIFSYGYLGWYVNNQYIYGGEPAEYTSLRVRLTIPNTIANFDFSANIGSASAGGDYSLYLGKAATASQVVNAPTTSQSLKTPEYTDEWIFGATPYDGQCTYWESVMGKCLAPSASLMAANTATCGSGEVKILVNTIVSNYPCNDSYVTGKVNWCAGTSTQIVADYQQWSVLIEAATENTTTQGF